MMWKISKYLSRDREQLNYLLAMKFWDHNLHEVATQVLYLLSGVMNMVQYNRLMKCILPLILERSCFS